MAGRTIKYKPAHKYWNNEKQEEQERLLRRYENEFPLKCNICGATWESHYRYFNKEKSICTKHEVTN